MSSLERFEEGCEVCRRNVRNTLTVAKILSICGGEAEPDQFNEISTDPLMTK